MKNPIMASRLHFLLFLAFTISPGWSTGRPPNPISPPGHRCPLGMHLYKTWCFFYTKEVASHPVAEDKCKKQGGFLAQPKDLSTQLFIKNITHGGRYDSYWIGLREINSSWVFGDGTPLGTFRYWAPYEPGGARDEDCVLLGSQVMTKWVTTQCHWGYRFICQINAGCNTEDLEHRHLLIKNKTSQFIPVGESLPVYCEEGHGVLEGPSEIKCEETRQWSSETLCVPGCSPPMLPRSMFLTNTRNFYRIGETPSLQCDEGFILVNPGITCNVDGKWTGNKPECKHLGEIATIGSCINTPTVEVTTKKMEPIVKTVSNGGSLSVTCIPGDRRTPKSWVWMKEQRVLERPNSSIPYVRVHNNGTLHITHMTSQAEGYYSCLAESLTEKGEVVYQTIHVLMPKTCDVDLEINLDSKNHISLGDDHVLLRCFAKNATTKWYLGKKTLISNQRHRILPNGALLVKKSLLVGTSRFRCVVEHLHTRCRTEQETSVHAGNVDLEAICGRVEILPDHSNSSSKASHGKIVGGQEAVKGSHPWIVIFTTVGGDGQEKFLCGGNLVSDKWVVSASHCFYWVDSAEKLRSMKAKLGKYDRLHSETGEKVVGIERVIVHPAFDKLLQSFDNDIALVKLKESVPFSEHITPICLPPSNFLDDFYPVQYGRSSGLVSGWGRLQEDGPQPRYMHQIRLPLVDSNVCQASTDQPVTKNMFCAGYEQAVGDSCQGDSGGPFEITRNDQVYLAGIVSWGEGCARPGKYGFYTRIENYRNYILRYIIEY